ncbi:hypothetical protein DSO57_1028777 [Entomophthora muscae]|uniref:Uncharacterized protein n=1 Tax=Entomophthora muscae TaxID=34485 RepID=A0ACC2SQE7_9FUNG|nr:hypothetical protein DSO57_1028777 [Entomophthora muscae]
MILRVSPIKAFRIRFKCFKQTRRNIFQVNQHEDSSLKLIPDMPCSLIRQNPLLCRVMMPNGEHHIITPTGLPAKMSLWSKLEAELLGKFQRLGLELPEQAIYHAIRTCDQIYTRLTHFNQLVFAEQRKCGEYNFKERASGRNKVTLPNKRQCYVTHTWLPVRDGSLLPSELDLVAKSQKLLMYNHALMQLLPLRDRYQIYKVGGLKHRFSKPLIIGDIFPATSVHGLPLMLHTKLTLDLICSLMILFADPLEPYLQIPSLDLFTISRYDTREQDREAYSEKPFLARESPGFRPTYRYLNPIKSPPLFPSVGYNEILSSHKCISGVAATPKVMLPAKEGPFGEHEASLFLKLADLGLTSEEAMMLLPTRTLAQLPMPKKAVQSRLGLWEHTETASLIRMFWALGFSAKWGFDKVRLALESYIIGRRLAQAVGSRSLLQCRTRMLYLVNSTTHLAQLLSHESPGASPKFDACFAVWQTPLSAAQAKHRILLHPKSRPVIQSSRPLEKLLMDKGLCYLLASPSMYLHLPLGVDFWAPNRFVDSIHPLSVSSPVTANDLIIFDRLISLPISRSLLRLFFPGWPSCVLESLFLKLNRNKVRNSSLAKKNNTTTNPSEILELFLAHESDWEAFSDAMDRSLSPEQCRSEVTRVLDSRRRRDIPSFIYEYAADKFLMMSRLLTVNIRGKLLARDKRYATITRFKLIASPIHPDKVRCFDYDLTDALPHIQSNTYTFISPLGKNQIEV